MKNLFLMCGCPGSGKTTWVRKQMDDAKYRCVHISRDEIRFSMLKEGEDYFAHENEVFEKFIERIIYEIHFGNAQMIFVDATHLNEKSRNKTLDRLNLNDVKLYMVDFNLPVEVCLTQNENRKGTLAYVPRGVIRRMHSQHVAPHENEKYGYAHVLTVGLPNGEEY